MKRRTQNAERRTFLLLFLILAWPCQAERLSGVIHIHSAYSNGGTQSLEQIVQKAKQAGIDVLFLSDHALARWEFGVWPLRGLLRRSMEKISILKATPEKYLGEIALLQKKHPDVLLIPGAECAPAYFWTGHWWKKNLTLHNWHKHLLAVGLTHPQDYYGMPLVSNPYEGSARHWKSLLLFALAALSGMAVFRVSSKHGLLLLGLGLVGFLNAGLMPKNKFSPHQDAGLLPYQNFIDYVLQRGGLVFWNHPEAPNWKDPVPEGTIHIQTQPYPEALLKTEHYTGFAVLWEGLNVAGKPGGPWDQTLVEYCQGRRDQPVWAIGELDYRQDGLNGTFLDSVKMVFDSSTRSTAGVIEAMKAGKFYTVLKSRDAELLLDNFSVSHALVPTVHIRLSSRGRPLNARVSLIREGRVLTKYEGWTPLEFEYQDRDIPLQKTYYRLEVECLKDTGRIFTNPIFVERGREEQ